MSTPWYRTSQPSGVSIGVGPAPIFVASQESGTGRHDVPVPAPVHEVGALGVVDVAERRVAAVARAAQHRVALADSPREEDAVPVEGEERVVELVEGLEVVRVRDPDGRAVVPVAPADVVPVLEPRDPRVVRVEEAPPGSRGTRPSAARNDDRLVVDLPRRLRRRCGPAWTFIVRRRSSTRNTPAKPSPNAHDRGVEDAVRAGRVVAGDDRVAARAPEDVARSRGPLLPGDRRHVALRRDLGAGSEARHRPFCPCPPTAAK